MKSVILTLLLCIASTLTCSSSPQSDTTDTTPRRTSTTTDIPTTPEDELYKFLSGIQQLMTGQQNVDTSLYYKLIDCIKKTDDHLYESVNAQWSGLKGFAQSKGSNGDNWYNCDSTTKPHQTWSERNCTVQPYGNIPVWEPCNYASNIAYYHTVVEQCAKESWNMPSQSVKTIIKAYASLGAGSSFMHMSETNTGGISDVRVNDLIGYVAFYETMKAFKVEGSVLHELSDNPRKKTVDQIVDEFMMMYINEPVEKWGSSLNQADIGSLPLSMCGFFSSALTMVFDDKTVDVLVKALLKAFHTFTDRPELKLCVEKFLPAVRNATSDFRPLPLLTKAYFGRNLVGTALKLIYAFLWQEQIFPHDSTVQKVILDPMVNEYGSLFLPTFNSWISKLEAKNMKYSDPTFGTGKNFYSGEDKCSWDPHAKWHMQTSIALTDFIFLADQFHGLLKDHQK